MPVIPPEGTYSEAELRFIEAQPPGLWPENQDSNFGQLRKVLTDELQARRDEIEMIAAERFPDTADNYLSLWEEMLGAAVDTTGKSIEQRRAVIQSRLKYGAFTRLQLQQIVEGYLTTTTGGTPAAFGPSGIPILGGIPLYGSSSPVSQLYRIYERPLDYAYDIWIDASNVPDIDALSRSLSRVTPAGVTFTIDTSHTGAALINWGKTVEGFGPSGWWKLGADFNDYSGLAQHGSTPGTVPAVIGGNGLIGAAGTDGARDFNGSSDFVEIVTPTNALNSRTWTFYARIRPDAFGTVGNYNVVYNARGAAQFNFMGIGNYTSTNRYFMARVAHPTDGALYQEITGSLPILGQTYSLIARYDGYKLTLLVDGTIDNEIAFPYGSQPSGAKNIGAYFIGAHYFNGGLDEVLHFGYPMTDDEILYLHKQATNQL